MSYSHGVLLMSHSGVTNVLVEDIKIKFRLRDPSDEKVVEIAESISQIGLLNPLTLDTKHHLIAGYQ